MKRIIQLRTKDQYLFYLLQRHAGYWRCSCECWNMEISTSLVLNVVLIDAIACAICWMDTSLRMLSTRIAHTYILFFYWNKLFGTLNLFWVISQFSFVIADKDKDAIFDKIFKLSYFKILKTNSKNISEKSTKA